MKNLEVTFIEIKGEDQMSQLTIKAINKELKKRGYEEKIARGYGYFYFYDGNAASWYQSGTYISRLNDLTLEGWINERQNLADRHCY